MGFSTDEASGSGGAGLGTLTGIIEATSGVAAVADPALDYISPAKTANVASATTITLPETGILIPITGTTTIDYITKPTGDLPRTVILWFQSVCTIRHEVSAAPGAGATKIAMFPGGTANTSYSHPANSLLMLEFEGTQWRKFPIVPHWNGTAFIGPDANSFLGLISSSASLSFSTGNRAIKIDATGTHLINDATVIDINGRFVLVQGSVASATQITPPLKGSSLVTGTTQIDTFVPTGMVEGQEISLEFDGILTITNNSGGTNDFVSKDGANIATSAGMVLKFRFDGTDLREIGR